MQMAEKIKKRLKKYLSFKGLLQSRSVVVGDINNQSQQTAAPAAAKKSAAMTKKSKSWNSGEKYKNHLAPDGCFPVYVGPEKQRFVVKTKFTNHPLFRMLLEDAEIEYGYNSQGPILLPCDVGLFYDVLAEMDSGDDKIWSGAGEGRYVAGLIACSPLRLTRSCGSEKSYGGYRLLSRGSPMI